MNVLKQNFYALDTLKVARELLGKKLVRKYRGHRLSGLKLWVEVQMTIPQRFIKKGPCIGIDYARAADRRAALRFWIDEEYVNDMMNNDDMRRKLSDD